MLYQHAYINVQIDTTQRVMCGTAMKSFAVSMPILRGARKQTKNNTPPVFLYYVEIMLGIQILKFRLKVA